MTILPFFSHAAELPQHFVLRPTTSVSVPQGQEAKVICESEGVSITELQWKKQTIKGDVSVPDNMVTIVRDWSNNRVSAILKITNAQSQDGGVYKCVLTVFDRTDYRLTTIIVKGTFFLNKKNKDIFPCRICIHHFEYSFASRTKAIYTEVSQVSTY